MKKGIDPDAIIISKKQLWLFAIAIILLFGALGFLGFTRPRYETNAAGKVRRVVVGMTRAAYEQLLGRTTDVSGATEAREFLKSEPDCVCNEVVDPSRFPAKTSMAAVAYDLEREIRGQSFLRGTTTVTYHRTGKSNWLVAYFAGSGNLTRLFFCRPKPK